MTKHLLSILLLLFLTGCQVALTPAPASLPAWTPIPIPTAAPGDEIAPPAQPSATAAATLASADSGAHEEAARAVAAAESEAAAVARAYFAALEADDFTSASTFYSDFSLMLAGNTRAEAALALQGQMAAGTKWSALEVKDTQWFNGKTPLVHLVYQKETKDAKTGKITQATVDELWPLRLENGQWRYNLGNLIDYLVLDVQEQTTAGLTVKPRQLTRYTDRVRLTLMVQNRTNEPIVLGQANEIMAAFTFSGQHLEAEKKQLIFDHLRSYPDITLEVKGLHINYPDGIIIRQWKGLKVAPWYTFKFTD
jgi:hypothetical protein